MIEPPSWPSGLNAEIVHALVLARVTLLGGRYGGADAKQWMEVAPTEILHGQIGSYMRQKGGGEPILAAPFWALHVGHGLINRRSVAEFVRFLRRYYENEKWAIGIALPIYRGSFASPVSGVVRALLSSERQDKWVRISEILMHFGGRDGIVIWKRACRDVAAVMGEWSESEVWAARRLGLAAIADAGTRATVLRIVGTSCAAAVADFALVDSSPSELKWPKVGDGRVMDRYIDDLTSDRLFTDVRRSVVEGILATTRRNGLFSHGDKIKILEMLVDPKLPDEVFSMAAQVIIGCLRSGPVDESLRMSALSAMGDRSEVYQWPVRLESASARDGEPFVTLARVACEQTEGSATRGARSLLSRVLPETRSHSRRNSWPIPRRMDALVRARRSLLGFGDQDARRAAAALFLLRGPDTVEDWKTLGEMVTTCTDFRERTLLVRTVARGVESGDSVAWANFIQTCLTQSATSGFMRGRLVEELENALDAQSQSLRLLESSLGLPLQVLPT